MPLASPLTTSTYDTLMVGVRQRLPPRGLRAVRRQAGELEARQLGLGRWVRARALAFEVATAYADYFEATLARAALTTQLGLVDDVIAVTTHLVATGGATPAEAQAASLRATASSIDGSRAKASAISAARSAWVASSPSSAARATGSVGAGAGDEAEAAGERRGQVGTDVRVVAQATSAKVRPPTRRAYMIGLQAGGSAPRAKAARTRRR